VPYFVGPWAYLAQRRGVRQALLRAVGDGDAVILRVPSHLAAIVSPELRQAGRPYGVEVVGDPHDVFSPGAVKHPLRPFFRWWFARGLRRHCRQACAASYVTAAALQRRYPPGPAATAWHCSDVQLEGFLADDYRRASPKAPWRLVTVGTLEQLYKGTDLLIDALAQCRREGLDVELVVVGDGQHRASLAAQAARLGLGQRVHFRGHLPAGKAIQAELDEADLFVLPSRQEGLPRAMIEAMARALPCLGAAVGGIPELLPPEDIVPPNDAAALAAKIRAVLADCPRMEQMSMRNLERAGEYREDVLERRRNAFYRSVREATAKWLSRHRVSRPTKAGAPSHRRQRTMRATKGRHSAHPRATR
jgi:glycosyltransferase involved in cell wall biosynthesis